jgi:F0F1-type ATP synthase assembly protein I
VEIDYLEPNKRVKAKRIFMGYMIIMQFITTAIGTSLVGYFIGDRLNPESNLPTLLAAIGLIIGIIGGFVILVRMIKSEERYERSSRH